MRLVPRHILFKVHLTNYELSMYLCYIDESGHNGRKFNPNQPVQVLCGVLIDVTKINKTHRELELMKRFLHKNGISLTELKASDAYRGRSHWSSIKPNLRDKIFGMVLNWACDRSCKYIVCPIDTNKFFELKNKGCQYSNIFQFPYEAGALNILLAIQKHQVPKPKNKGKTIVIFDEQHDHDENLIRILEGDLSFTDSYTCHVQNHKNTTPRLSEIVDIPHFSKSHLSVLIQIADWVAFIVAQYMLLTSYKRDEKYDGELSKLTAWYTKIGESLINQNCLDPTDKDQNSICTYYKSIRPNGWTAKKWLVTC